MTDKRRQFALTLLASSIKYRALLTKVLLTIGISAVLAAPVTTGGAETGIIPSSSWSPAMGDTFLVDVGSNIGYLVHFDGSMTSFPVVTGQQRSVFYIGRSYYAATPQRLWVAESMDSKGNNTVTFGPTGRFFRLFKDGESSPYGIHGHRDAEQMLASQNRYRSMGCIIVSEPVLNVIEETYRKNEGRLDVKTVERVPSDRLEVATLLKE